MNTSTRRLHTSGFACLAHRGGGFSEEVEGSGMTSALLGWEAEGGGVMGGQEDSGTGARLAGTAGWRWPAPSTRGGPAQSRVLEGSALPATSCHFLQT